jgi:hypothetical protein
MLDSTAAVAAERRGKNARQLLESVALGSRRRWNRRFRSDGARTRSRHYPRRHNRTPRPKAAFLDELLTGVPIQPVTIPIALRAGQIDGQSQAKGIRIPLSDLLIGVSAQRRRVRRKPLKDRGCRTLEEM